MHLYDLLYDVSRIIPTESCIYPTVFETFHRNPSTTVTMSDAFYFVCLSRYFFRLHNMSSHPQVNNPLCILL